jgi:hypothetical protein
MTPETITAYTEDGTEIKVTLTPPPPPEPVFRRGRRYRQNSGRTFTVIEVIQPGGTSRTPSGITGNPMVNGDRTEVCIVYITQGGTIFCDRVSFLQQLNPKLIED